MTLQVLVWTEDSISAIAHSWIIPHVRGGKLSPSLPSTSHRILMGQKKEFPPSYTLPNILPKHPSKMYLKDHVSPQFVFVWRGRLFCHLKVDCFFYFLSWDVAKRDWDWVKLILCYAVYSRCLQGLILLLLCLLWYLVAAAGTAKL